MPVILATQEAEIWKIVVPSQPRPTVCKTLVLPIIAYTLSSTELEIKAK
jgi:hypothetical protein